MSEKERGDKKPIVSGEALWSRAAGREPSRRGRSTQVRVRVRRSLRV